MVLLGHVKGLLLAPDDEWQKIAEEPASPASLLGSYVVILAAIPAICGFIGDAAIGKSVSGIGTLRMPIFAALMEGLLEYCLAFVAVYVVAIIINLLAPSFGAVRSFPQALKLAVYSFTPLWLVGIFQLLPGLRFLAVLGLYGFFLLWKGLPYLMETPDDRSLGYAATITGCALAIQVAIAVALSILFTLPRPI